MKLLNIFIVLILCSCVSKNSEKQIPAKKINLELDIKKIKSPVAYSLRGISILDSNNIWISGAKGSILKSENSGKSWRQINSPDRDSLDFRSIHAFSDSSVIVASAGFPARVYKTINGGRNWELVYENLDSAAFLNSIAFKNNLEGIIIGDQLNGRHLILRSGNSGASWTTIDSLNIPKPFAIENAFAASGSCIAITKSGRFLIGLGGEKTRIFSSINGYKWKAKSTPMESGSATSGIYSIASSGNGKLMAVGGNYLYVDSAHYPIYSNNDGKSWIKTKAKVNGYRSVLDYSVTEKIWLAGGTSGIELSRDDGKSWIKISDENVNSFRFIPNSSKVVAMNNRGEILLINIHFLP